MAKIKKVRKYQNSGPALRAKSDNTSVSRRNPVAEDRMRARKTKDASDIKKMTGKYSVIAAPDRESTFRNDSTRYYPGQRGNFGTPYIRDLGGLYGVDAPLSNKDILNAVRSGKARYYEDTAAVKANKDFMFNQKNGGKTKKSMKTGGKITKAKTGTMVPKKSSVSKKVGSAKKSIGTRSMRRK